MTNTTPTISKAFPVYYKSFEDWFIAVLTAKQDVITYKKPFTLNYCLPIVASFTARGARGDAILCNTASEPLIRT